MKKTVLCPFPRNLKFAAGKYVCHGGICYPAGASARLKSQLAEFAEGINEYMPETPRVSPAPGIDCFLEVLTGNKKIPRQGYQLTVSARGVKIVSADEPGAFYGIQTLRQLFDNYGAELPCMNIKDYPDFPHRGVMLDISRCKVPAMSTLKMLIKRLAGLKLNHLQLYIEHTFAFSGHETVWRDASPLTAADIIELDKFCAEHCIELAPNFNSFGHFERWLKYPEYKHLAECPDGYINFRKKQTPCGSTLSPSRKSLRFLEPLFREYLANFTSPYFNAGCDETWELGRGWSKPKCDKLGTTRVYLDFLLKIHKLVQKYDRKMMFWGDIILHQPELIKELPEDIIALNWGYESRHPFARETRQFAESGVPFWVCPGTSSWNSITGRTKNCIENLFKAALHGAKNNSEGYLITDWGDVGHHQYLPVSYLGFAAGAAASWAHRANRNNDFPEILNKFFFRDAAGITGKLFYDLGKVQELSKVSMHNNSIFGRMLFWDMKPESWCGKYLVKVTPDELRACLMKLDELEVISSHAAPGCADAGIVMAEFLNAVNMCRHACQRGLLYHGEKLNMTEVRNLLRLIISGHERLWLARNRIGGLHESSEHLREAMLPIGGK